MDAKEKSQFKDNGKSTNISFLRFLKEVSMKYSDVDEHCFTQREKEVILLMANGLNSMEIANKLFISKYTVDTHRKNIYRKGKFNGLRDVILFVLFMDLGPKNTQNWVFSNVA